MKKNKNYEKSLLVQQISTTRTDLLEKGANGHISLPYVTEQG